MRPEPLYLSWCIRIPSEEDALRVGAVLDGLSTTGEGLTSTVYTQPGGVPVTWVEPHSLDEFFESVSLNHAKDDPCTLHLIFERKRSAGRFWKDVMVKVLTMIGTNVAGASIAIEYKGDVAPSDPLN